LFEGKGFTMKNATTKRTRPHVTAGFTLIELLVVVAIIALLLSILMPSLGKAKQLSRSSACLSNLHNIGLSLTMYHTEYEYYPSSYGYINGDSSAGGYYHWTAALEPTEYQDAITSGKYPRTAKQYVCPSHTPGGWAPTNFTTVRIPQPPPGQASQDASNTIDDRQGPRLSYVANEIILPRKKYSRTHDAGNPPGTQNLCVVSPDEIEAPANTILLAEFSSSANCIWGSSVGGGSAYKSHRPTNGIKIGGGGVFDGEGYVMGTQVYKLTPDEAEAAIAAVLADKSAAPTNHHISYINPIAHMGSSNYAYADGHSAKATLKETLDPGYYQWGKKVYSCADKPVIQDNP
jgi:prepilin-type N-terminal cleavage/methylation domain-containing protein/prepilin-type processing-associated H-X9-DG protein